MGGGPVEPDGIAVLRRRLRLAMVVAGAAILAGLGLVVATSGSEPDGSTDPVAFDLPALGEDGRVRLADFRGTPVVVNFFASWCTSCDFELPGFVAAADALRGEVTFIAVNALETGDWKDMAERHQLREHGFVLARDIGGREGSGLHAALGGRGMPITAFYDEDGVLVDGVGGALPESALFEKLRQLYDVEL
ncbi:MAG: TlpA family protein disulfide reductase [Microbacteriaceae bacterium]